MSKKIGTKAQGLGYYYDEELFNNAWASEPDPTSLVLLDSGLVVNDPNIEDMISGGGNYYTIPFYKDLEGNPQKYDGLTDATADYTEDGAQSGVVYGQMKEFANNVFVRDFTSADPMGNIVKRITKYWSKVDIQAIINLLNGIFGITGDTDWAKHTYDISTKTTTAADTNRIGLTTLRDASVKALGENANDLSLAIMHSTVANKLSNLQVLNFFTYQKDGMSYDVNVARSGNLICLVTDAVPVATSSTATGEKEYTTYIGGLGAILTAPAPVEKPSDYIYDAEKAGGTEKLLTRRRKTYHPNGFTFAMSNMPVSIATSDLATAANWTRVMKANNIKLVRVITN